MIIEVEDDVEVEGDIEVEDDVEDEINDKIVWMAWSFQVSFMYNSVL
jgi:hypothetical protein